MDGILTDNDVKVFATVADSMITAGLWTGYHRAPGAGCDLFDITDTSAAPNPAFSVGVCTSGRYAVMFHREGSIRFGRTLAEALAHIAYVPANATAA